MVTLLAECVNLKNKGMNIMKKTTTICFANNKGGSGKSTTCSNVGYSLVQSGKKVLLIDGDMQLNLTLSFFDEETVLEIAKGDKKGKRARLVRQRQPPCRF